MRIGGKAGWIAGCLAVAMAGFVVAAEIRSQQKDVVAGTRDSFNWNPLCKDSPYEMVLNVDNTDTKDFKVPSASGTGDGGANWTLTLEDTRNADFQKPIPNAEPKEDGKTYKPRFRGEFEGKGGGVKGGKGGGAPAWNLEGEYDVLKVDLDVDADYDEAVSVDDPDDPIEMSAGGLVGVGARDEIVLRKVAPPAWSGDVVLTKNSAKVKVFDAATGGTEITFDGTGKKFANSALPKTLYVQGETASDNLRDVTLTLTSTPGGCADEIAYTVLKVDLDIANGQSGPLLDDTKEESPGAFTVANLNDTDGDGTQDKSDDNVTATANGQDEVDLMKLVLRKPDPDLGDKVKLKVVSGDVKIWEQSKKVAEVTLTGGEVEFNTSDLDKTLWLEARAKSDALRDIEIELEYKGCKDTVKATGIWVEKTKFANTGTNLSTDADAGIKANHVAYGGKLGSAHVSPQTRNGEEHEFTVSPSGIDGEPGIVFDISRQKESVAWQQVTVASTNFVPVTYAGVVPSSFPAVEGEPNDDAGVSDEDNDALNDHIYSTDHPGASSDDAFAHRFVMRFNFNEFVRVLVNGGSFANNNGLVEGSRCSGYAKWRSRMDVTKDVATEKWTRTAEGENEIVEGHKGLGSAPTP